MQAPDAVIAKTPMGDLEAKMGIPPLEGLLAERDELVASAARLRAVHGPNGTYDALRKSELAKIQAMIRAQAVMEGKRVTENYLEESSHAHEQYAAWIAEMTSQKADWFIAENRIQGIADTIFRGNAIARYLASEAQL